jgi:hypothetical protein
MAGHIVNEASAAEYVRAIHDDIRKLRYKDLRLIRDHYWPQLVDEMLKQDFTDYKRSRMITNLRHYAAKKHGFTYPESSEIPDLPKHSIAGWLHNGMVSVSTGLTRVFGA